MGYLRIPAIWLIGQAGGPAGTDPIPAPRALRGFPDLYSLYHRSIRVQNWGLCTIYYTIYYTILCHTIVLESRVGGSVFGSPQGSGYRADKWDLLLGYFWSHGQNSL